MTGDKATILLSDSDMEIETKEGLDGDVSLSFISQDDSRFITPLSKRDREKLGRFLLGEDVGSRFITPLSKRDREKLGRFLLGEDVGDEDANGDGEQT